MESFGNYSGVQSKTVAGDFFALLKSHALAPFGASTPLTPGRNSQEDSIGFSGRATTVFGFQCRDGILMAGDRRATAGNVIVTDEVEKILKLDRESLLAIAGSPAVAFEMARVLRNSFEYYRRSQLQPLSLSGRTRAVARLLVENIPMALQGIGLVAPLFAGLDRSINNPDKEPEPRLFYYDPLGAQFQAATHAASGSGSGHVRSILEFHERFGAPRLKSMPQEEAIALALKLLQIASTYDAATGGVDPEARRFATIYIMTRNGVHPIDEAMQLKSWRAGLQQSSKMEIEPENQDPNPGAQND